MSYSRIGIVTPLHNEIDSIDALFESISNQSCDIEHWLILENGSSDGSKEYLAKKNKPDNVRNMHIINSDDFGKKHELGFKYSRIVRHAFDLLLIKSESKLDYIGILDSDCFPDSRYYSQLVSFLSANNEVGITSGRIYLKDGSLDKANKDWVRGGSRLWKFECFEKSGYIVAPSADAVSSALAEMNGWQSKVCGEARVNSREVGARVNYAYYGYAAYYRGCSLAYASVRTVYLFKKNPLKAHLFFWGFFKNWVTFKPKIDNEKIKEYFSGYLVRKFTK